MSMNARFEPPALKAELARALCVDKLPAVISDSFDLAYKAHEGQWREPGNGSGEGVPYIVHPVGVAKLAVHYLPHANLEDEPENVIAACLLHDVLEDSETSLADIERAASRRTAALVLALTKPVIADDRSRAERHQIFLNQISDAGATARFIKACDAAHNLGRPDAVPLRLLEKLIQKSAGYIGLASIPQVGAPLLEELQKRVALARQRLDSYSYGNAQSVPADTEAAFALLETRASSKTLEVHDIAELLIDLTAASAIKVGAVEVIVPEAADKTVTRQRVNLTRQADKGWINPDEIGFSMAGHLDGDKRSLVIDVGHVFGSEIYVAGLFGPRTPDWLGPATFRALALRSFDRLRAGQQQRWLDVHTAISRLGLDLEPDLAARVGLTIPQLEGLSARLESAEYVRRNAVAAIERLVAGSRHGLLLDRMESRTKTARSIVQKMAKREIASFEDLDDLVGLRVIAASRRAIQSIRELLTAALVNPASDLARMVNPFANSVNDKMVTSSSGYIARHICFQAASPSVKFDAIACELQLRTLQEDAWARTSHLLLYKNPQGKSRTRTALRELSEMRDAADSLIDRI